MAWKNLCGLVLSLGPLTVWSCAGALENDARRELERHPGYASAGGRQHLPAETAARAAAAEAASPHPANPPLGKRGSTTPGLAACVASALEHGPRSSAAFERWKAAVHGISQARRLPNPRLGFGFFLRSIETRVGPQRGRLGLSQTIPWPGQLSAKASASAAKARAARQTLEAVLLSIRRRVADAYWSLWQLRQARAIHQRHLEVMRGLSETVRARVSTGHAGLADQQQVDVAVARLEDSIWGMRERERVAEARLGSAVGSEGNCQLSDSSEPPNATLPRETDADLEAAARRHPRLQALRQLSQAEEHAAERARADRYPNFSLAAEWIVVGAGAGVADDGKDALVVGGGIELPLWQSNYGDAEKAARARARAHRADHRGARDQAVAHLRATLSAVRDATRRTRSYRHTLLPQAESAYASVLGAYATGRGGVAQALLSQRDLLELRVELVRARADHARAWSALEDVVGCELTRREPAEASRLEGGDPQ